MANKGDEKWTMSLPTAVIGIALFAVAAHFGLNAMDEAMESNQCLIADKYICQQVAP